MIVPNIMGCPISDSQYLVIRNRYEGATLEQSHGDVTAAYVGFHMQWCHWSSR